MAGVNGFEAVKDGGLELLVGGVVAAVEGGVLMKVRQKHQTMAMNGP